MKNKKQQKIKQKIQEMMGYISFGFFVMMAFSLTACVGSPLALLDKVQSGVETVKDSTYNTAARSIDGYCDRLPLPQRQKFRHAVNSRTAKGDIFITCIGDK